MTKISDISPDDESLKKENPLLHSIPKGNPFSVPENYFDALPSQIVDKCRQNTEPKKWGEGILTNILAYKWRILSTLSCLVLFIFVMRMNNNNTSYEAMAKNIPDSLIVEHLDNNIADISISSLEDLQVSENNAPTAKNASDSTNTDQDIIAYLMNNNVSVSDIVNE